jgi:hypothetical protein
MRTRSFRPLLALTIAVSVAGVLAPAARGDATNAILPRTTSASQQFIAYASSPLLSSAICVFAERMKRAWLAELDMPDHWRDPIIVALRERDSFTAGMPLIRVDAFQNEFHLKYQITCMMPPLLDEQLMGAAVVETLCEEFANREQPTSQTTGYIRAPIPPWLTLGLTESLRGRTDSLLEIERRSVSAGHPQTASELIAMTTLPADPAEEELFRANAWMLTEGLLSVPNGKEKMRRFLTELGVTKSVSNAFSLVYETGFPQEVTLEKWWSLRLAQCTAVSVAQNSSLAETARRLEAILPTALVQKEGKEDIGVGMRVSLDKLWRYYEKPWLRDVLKEKLNSLELLRSEAHPFYRSVIERYLEAVVLLMNEKLNRFRRAVAVADRNRAAVDEKVKQITAYLNQEERIYSPEESTNLFTGYFQTLDQIQALEKNRHNPISDYLDRFDH